MKYLTLCIGLGLLSLAHSANAKELVKAPRGWSDNTEADERIISNGNATVIIGPWQSLKGDDPKEWLIKAKDFDPQGGILISTEAVKPDRLPGTFSVLRDAKFGSKKGKSVLYLCPGLEGHARLMTLNVNDGGFVDLFKGAMFGENVCKKEPKGSAGKSNSEEPTSKKPVKSAKKSSKPTKNSSGINYSDKQLSALNKTIPKHNRPTNARLHSKQVFEGFPAMLITKVFMVLEFNDGTKLRCTNWSPIDDVKAKELAEQKKCQVDEEQDMGQMLSFKPGERIDLKFGTIGGVSYDFLDSSGSTMSGGNLVMNKKGEIALGKWSVAHVSAAAMTSSATSTTKNKPIVGRYYLDGNTITIATKDGDIVHGFIGHTKDDDKIIRGIYISGTHYWDRS